jgi:hypothetical protein
MIPSVTSIGIPTSQPTTNKMMPRTIIMASSGVFPEERYDTVTGSARFSDP